jgi:hypothetical protein
MIAVPTGVRIWIATGHTDMRKGMQGLALLVQEDLGRDPFAGDVFVFPRICTASDRATRSSSRIWVALMSGLPRTATRDVPGMISLRICRCLPLNSERSRNSPVMLPPGRAMLATSPASTGSISRSIPTIGMVRVAFECFPLFSPITDIGAKESNLGFSA